MENPRSQIGFSVPNLFTWQVDGSQPATGKLDAVCSVQPQPPTLPPNDLARGPDLNQTYGQRESLPNLTSLDLTPAIMNPNLSCPDSLTQLSALVEQTVHPIRFGSTGRSCDRGAYALLTNFSSSLRRGECFGGPTPHPPALMFSAPSPHTMTASRMLWTIFPSK